MKTVLNPGFQIVIYLLLAIFLAPLLSFAEPSYTIPDEIDEKAHYLFFFHNYYVRGGPGKLNKPLSGNPATFERPSGRKYGAEEWQREHEENTQRPSRQR